MRLCYKHWKTKRNSYFMYINWVKHKGFGKPKLKLNYKTNVLIAHLFDFSWGKFHAYLVKV